MVTDSPGFQRARRPEQVEARRCAILDTARALLRRRPVSEISLRELSETVGLAKSNVLRYFGSREAIFLEVLHENLTAWLDELTLSPAPGGPAPFAAEIHAATEVAASLTARPQLCELISVTGGVLEKNIPLADARQFKERSAAHQGRLATIVRDRLPGLPEDAARHFAMSVFVTVAGLWPYASPSDAVAQVMTERGLPPAGELFASALTEALANQLTGLSARYAAR
ncbi:TetR/AcrR family transcriptional regulator [Longispora albida]|uniref:TetR/AcrR family transcriptional regulator n=1 Tax=Longispora albida TaxID=203523 RepID=UPI00035FD98D|nr:TetR family transcriptional regulator [Longispora albida]